MRVALVHGEGQGHFQAPQARERHGRSLQCRQPAQEELPREGEGREAAARQAPGHGPRERPQGARRAQDRRVPRLPMKPEDAEVLAAGGLILRPGGEIAVVHRPRYDDWSLPKGKLDEGEGFEEAALREVLEETGLTCRIERHLGDTSYHDRKDRPKLVRYYAMSPESGEFEPNDEVDELRWLSPAEANELLSYDFDRELVGKLS